MESTDDVPLDPTYRQYDGQWKVVVLPPRRYEGKCKNNDAPLALASANTTHLVIGAWCTQGALGLQSTRVRLTKRSRSRSERLDRRNVGDWFRVLEKKGRRTSRGAQGLARASLLCGTRCPNTFAQPLRSTRGFVSLSPSLSLSLSPSLLPPETRKIWRTYSSPIFRSHAETNR